MNLSQKLLCFFSPKTEERRRSFRECIAMTLAHSEDVDRTIKINGFEFRKFMEEEKKP